MDLLEFKKIYHQISTACMKKYVIKKYGEVFFKKYPEIDFSIISFKDTELMALIEKEIYQRIQDIIPPEKKVIWEAHMKFNFEVAKGTKPTHLLIAKWDAVFFITGQPNKEIFTKRRVAIPAEKPHRTETLFNKAHQQRVNEKLPLVSNCRKKKESFPPATIYEIRPGVI